MSDDLGKKSRKPDSPTHPQWALKIAATIGGIGLVVLALTQIMPNIRLLVTQVKELVCELPICDSSGTDIEKIRSNITSEGPTEIGIENAARTYRFNDNKITSIEEIKLFLNYLKPDTLYQRDKNSVSAVFDSSWEITIWINTYSNADTYGVRHGLKDGNYWAENHTYQEIRKLGNGTVAITEPQHLRNIGQY